MIVGMLSVELTGSGGEERHDYRRVLEEGAGHAVTAV